MWTLLVVSQVSYYRYTVNYFSVSGSLGTPHSRGNVAPCYYESSMIVVGVIFPHRTRFVTFSFQKLERKKKSTAVFEGTLSCGRHSNAGTAVFLNFWTADRDYLFYPNTLFIRVRAVTHVTWHMQVDLHFCYISTREASTKYKELAVRPTYCKQKSGLEWRFLCAVS